MKQEQGNGVKKTTPGYYFTSESVSSGHPDKVADIVSDSVLDAILEQDDKARVACETCNTTDFLMVFGEVTTKAQVDYEKIARDAVKEIGYHYDDVRFNYETLHFMNLLHTQSPDISMGVDKDGVVNAGDQGMMIGGAVNETPELLPLPIALAKALTNKYDEIRQDNEDFRPDAKAQVTVKYDNSRKPIAIDTVLMSVSHREEISQNEIKDFLSTYVIAPVLTEYGYNIFDVNRIIVNPTGKFVVCGPDGDSGLTGRKLAVDSYGSYFCDGGGAKSGKDPSKVDRSGAYMARYVAKNVVASGVADKCEVQLSYAIGMPYPISININTHGTGRFPIGVISRAIREHFDLSVNGIINSLDLTHPKFKYADCASKGHFGEFVDNLPWERTDKADAIKHSCELAMESKGNFNGKRHK